MKLSWKFWQRSVKSAPATRNIILNDLDSSFLGCSILQETVTPQKAFNFYQSNSAVATAVDMVSQAYEQIQQILEFDDGTIIEQHDVLALLKNPNPYMDGSGFKERLCRHFLLTAQAHLYLVGLTGRPPIELHPIKPLQFTTECSGEYVSKYYSGFGVSTGVYCSKKNNLNMMRYYDGPVRELYRIAGFSSRANDSTADSPLQAAVMETNQQIKGRIHNTALLDNGGRPSLLVVFKDEDFMSDDQNRARAKRINESVTGTNKGKIIVTSGGDLQQITEMGLSQKDMDYSEMDKQAGMSIYKRYRIPLPLVYTDTTTFNNMETGVEMFYDFAVLPVTDKLNAGLSRCLLPRYGLDPNKVKITYRKDSLGALKKRMLEELKLRQDIGVETPNEIRECMPNREPVENGDVVYINASRVPMGQDLDEPEARTVDDNGA